MNRRAEREREWRRLREVLPADLEASARKAGCIRRALRSIPSAEALLRLFLVYSSSGWSFRDVSVWALATGCAVVSGSALQEHLAAAGPWLANLLAEQLLALAATMPASTFGGLTVVICDGTTANRPGVKGTDYRIHLSLNLGAMALVGVEVTTAKEGETLARFKAQAGQLVVADRGFAFRSSIYAVVEAGARVLVRINWENLPLLDQQGNRLDLLEVARCSRVGLPLNTPVVVAADPRKHIPAIPARLITVRKPLAETLRTREAQKKEANRKGRTLRQQTLAAAEFIFLLTTATAAELPTWQAPVLYRWRWQIEIYIKRCKSLLGLDEIRARNDASVEAVLNAKLLATVVLHQLCPMKQVMDLDSPLPARTMRSVWRTWKHLWDGFKDALGMHLSLSEWREILPRLEKRLADAPRERTLVRQRQYQRMCDEIGWDAGTCAHDPTRAESHEAAARETEANAGVDGTSRAALQRRSTGRACSGRRLSVPPHLAHRAWASR